MKSEKHLFSSPIIPDYGYFPLAVTFLFNMSIYCGSRMITRNWYHHNFESGFDRLIPFVPWTVFFYLASYFFWITNYILCVRIGRIHAYRFLSADLFAKCICFLFFLLLPTANTRPEIIGNDFWNTVMKYLYQIDSADNLFPSIHCLVSQLCCIGLRNRSEIPGWYKWLSCFMALAVFISTLTTKQHVIIDVIGGIFLAEFSFWYMKHSRFPAKYQKLCERINAHLHI